MASTSHEPATAQLALPEDVEQLRAQLQQLRSTLAERDAEADLEERRRDYAELANHYYDLVTDFYRFGWGPSFHFAPRRAGETFLASLEREQHRLAADMELGPGKAALDVGCGIGGPMREIARHSGAIVAGINNNAYQSMLAERANVRTDLVERCPIQVGDFMRIDQPGASYDAAYCLGTTCYAPDETAAFVENARVLKTGGILANHEWCLTPPFDPADPDHHDIKRRIEIGSGLPVLSRHTDVASALEAAGYDVIEFRDIAHDCDESTPW